MVELVDLKTTDEDLIKIIDRMATAAGITHRTSPKESVPIIILLIKILKEARKASKNLKYSCPGYTINGHVRVKKLDGDEFIPIDNKNDLRNIK